MSSSKPLEMQMITSVFEHKSEAGYVLNFSNKDIRRVLCRRI